ncbi:TetR/AcrR family transcriptional regulator [Celeribacter halophilus]|nr:TetR/AcrR family transcriptional regulator [Celeribacter halophilus]
MPRPASYDRTVALHAAMTVFWEKGFHATSLKDLEASLKMKPGSIYAAFNSKEQLYSSAMKYYFEAARDSFRDEMARAPSPLVGLADHIRSYANLPTDHPGRQVCMLLKTIVDTQTTEPALSRQAREHLRDIRAQISAVLDEAKRQGELPTLANCNRLARRFQANLNALRVELHQSDGTDDLTDLADDMACEVEGLRDSS